MLSIPAMQAALPIAVKAAQRNQSIKALDNTPLSELSRICFIHSPAALSGSTQSFHEAIQQYMQDMKAYTSAQSLDEADTTSHDYVLDNLSEFLIQTCSRHLSYFRNVVKPTIDGIYQAIQELMAVPPTVGAGFDIVVHDLPAPMQDGRLQSEVSHASKSYVDPERCFILPTKAPQEIYELLSTGQKDHDALINAWIVKMGDTWMVQAWEAFFVKGKASVSNFKDLLQYADESDDYALFVYLIANRLQETVLEDSQMPLPMYRNVTNQYLAYAKTAMASAYKTLECNVADKILVKALSPMSQKIVVHGPVYRDWLNTAGDNDILLGLLVSQETMAAVDRIDANAQRLKDIWSDYLHMQEVAHVNNHFNEFIRAADYAFSKSFDQVLEEEKAYFLENSAHLQNATQQFREALKTLRPSDLDDMYLTLTRLICRTRFSYTQAEDYLLMMIGFIKADAKLTPADAAMMADLDFVASWIAQQLTLTD